MVFVVILDGILILSLRFEKTKWVQKSYSTNKKIDDIEHDPSDNAIRRPRSADGY